MALYRSHYKNAKSEIIGAFLLSLRPILKIHIVATRVLIILRDNYKNSCPNPLGHREIKKS